MDFSSDDKHEAFRAEVRAELEELVTPELEEQMYRTGVSHDPEFCAVMRERGWNATYWPGRWGSDEFDSVQLTTIREELQRSDAPVYATGTTAMGAKALDFAGSEDLKAELLPKAEAGEIISVLGFSEPEAGSDVANAQLRAVRDGDEWVMNGSKMFTTNAQIADYVLLLTRTNTEVPKHQGLTVFLVPMDSPGVEVQAVFTLSGERTNITYYSDVRVDDRYRIGEVDGGWTILMEALHDEHSAGFGARTSRLLDETEAWARQATDVEGSPRIAEPDVRERLARCATDVEVSLLLQRRTAWMRSTGQPPDVEGPYNKLFSSEALERSAEDLTEMLGPDGLRSFLDPTAPSEGRIEHARRFSIGTTIYAGTSEVQRNIIAQRGLGLPR